MSRVASTARRGANVPNGVPGVYRVPRVIQSTIAASDTGSAAPAAADWVQPADVSSTISAPGGIRTNTDSSYAWAFYPDPIQATTAVSADGTGAQWQTIAFRIGPDNLSAPPTSPTPPAGMTVEYESTYGTLLTATIFGQVIVSADAGVASTPQAEVWEFLESDIVPGLTYSGYGTGPIHTTAGNPVWSHSGQGTFSFTTPVVSFPAGSQTVGWRIADIHGLQETIPAVTGGGSSGGGIYVTSEGPSSASVQLTYTYRPPRYRFV